MRHDGGSPPGGPARDGGAAGEQPHGAADAQIPADLEHRFPGWRIWRTRDDRGRPAGWAATRTTADDVEPTLHATTAEGLAELLSAPGRRVGRGVPGLEVFEAPPDHT